jgi:hypothetical protein
MSHASPKIGNRKGSNAGADIGARVAAAVPRTGVAMASALRGMAAKRARRMAKRPIGVDG